MIPNEEKEDWHYLVVKNIYALLKEITSKYDCNFYCLNCLHSRRRDKKLKSHKKRKTTSENDNMLKLNQYLKSDKMPYTTYVTIESLIKK